METGSVNDSSPKWSIGMPVFNGERFLREALDSIPTQRYHDFELIISDPRPGALGWQGCTTNSQCIEGSLDMRVLEVIHVNQTQMVG